MARRRRTVRRSLRSFGAVLVNPRRRSSRRRTRRNPPASKAYASHFPVLVPASSKRGGVRAYRRRKPMKLRGALKGKRRIPAAWRYGKNKKAAGRPASRRARSVFKRYGLVNPRRRRGARRSFRRVSRRFRARRNPSLVSISRRKARRNGRRRFGAIRRNPAFVSKLTSPIQRIARKIPVVGAPLAVIVGQAPHAAIGAVALEPALFLASKATQMLAGNRAGAWLATNPHFALLGSAAVVSQVARLAVKDAGAKDRISLAILSAGAGAAYILWKTGISAPASSLGAVTLGAIGMDGVGAYGEGPAYTVSPMGGAYGAVILGQ